MDMDNMEMIKEIQDFLSYLDQHGDNIKLHALIVDDVKKLLNKILDAP